MSQACNVRGSRGRGRVRLLQREVNYKPNGRSRGDKKGQHGIKGENPESLTQKRRKPNWFFWVRGHLLGKSCLNWEPGVFICMFCLRRQQGVLGACCSGGGRVDWNFYSSGPSLVRKPQTWCSSLHLLVRRNVFSLNVQATRGRIDTTNSQRLTEVLQRWEAGSKWEWVPAINGGNETLGKCPFLQGLLAPVPKGPYLWFKTQTMV